MTYLEAMSNYYSGQRYVALAGGVCATLCLLVARAAYVRKTYPGRSFAITVFLLAGLFMLPANVGYLIYVGPQSTRIGSTLERSPSDFAASEMVHLEKMMEGFRLSYWLDSTVALLGVLTVVAGIARKSRRAAGAGLGVMLCFTMLLAGEVWSKHRALHYREALLAARGVG